MRANPLDAGPNEPVPDDTTCAVCSTALPDISAPDSYDEMGFCSPACVIEHLLTCLDNGGRGCDRDDIALGRRALKEIVDAANDTSLRDVVGKLPKGASLRLQPFTVPYPGVRLQVTMYRQREPDYVAERHVSRQQVDSERIDTLGRIAEALIAQAKGACG
jgi:hypothetical protein